MQLIKTALSTISKNRELAFQARFWRSVFYYFFNIKGHLCLFFLLKKRPASAIVHKFPRTRYKYLFAYVSPQFGTARKFHLLYNHYRLADHFFKDYFLEEVCQTPACLWRHTVQNDTYEIKLTFPDHGEEGDLSIEFYSNRSRLYRLIFILAIEKASDGSLQNTLMVSAVQGIKNYDDIKRATEQLSDCQPAFLLMTAMEGIALSLGMGTVLGLGCRHQITSIEGISFSYDKFWENFGTPVGDTNIFEVTIPLPVKNILEIPSRHRKRTQVKRAFKDQIRADVATNLSDHLRHPLPRNRSAQEADPGTAVV